MELVWVDGGIRSMTTQQDVIEAFIDGEDRPRRASNFRMVQSDDGLTEYLIGDDRFVYAKREPINRITLYRGSLRGNLAPFSRREFDDLSIRHLIDQHRLVYNVIEHEDMPDSQLEQDTDAPPRAESLLSDE